MTPQHAVTAGVGIATCVVAWRASRRAPARARLRRLTADAALPRRTCALQSAARGALERAGIALEPDVALAVWAAGAGAAFLVFAPSAISAGAGAAGFVVVGAPFAVYLLRGRAGRQRSAALPRVVEDVASELRAGGTVPGGLARAASRAGPLRGELRRLHVRLDLGAPFADAARTWAAESDALGAGAVAGACMMAVAAGGPAADALDALAVSLDERIAIVAETRALSAQARASAYVVGIAPLGYLVFASVTDRALLRDLVATDVGRVCLVVGLTLEALGAACIRALMREEPSW